MLLSRVRVVLAPVVITEVLVPVPIMALVPGSIMALAPVVITGVLVPVPIMALVPGSIMALARVTMAGMWCTTGGIIAGGMAPGSIVALVRGASSAGVVEPSIPITAAAGTVTCGMTPMAMPTTILAMPRRRS